MNRRTFLQNAAGATALAAISPQVAFAADELKPKMKLSINSDFNVKIPMNRALAMIRNAGFEAISLGGRLSHSHYDVPKERAAIAGLLEKHGLTVSWVHAPFPHGDKLFSLNDSERHESIRQCWLALDTAKALDGRIVVIHMIQPYGVPLGEKRDKMIAKGLESIKVLVEYAARRNVKIAFENGQRKNYDEVLATCLKRFSSDQIGFCYDSGHENVQGRSFELLKKFSSRLIALHIDDNNGKSDQHKLPYEGSVDWDKFRKVIHSINFSGDLSLEVLMQNSQFKSPGEFLAEAKKRADRLLLPLPG